MEGAAPQTDLLPRVALGHRPCTSHDGVKTREMGCSIFAKWFADIFSTRIENLILWTYTPTHTLHVRHVTHTHSDAVSHVTVRGPGAQLTSPALTRRRAAPLCSLCRKTCAHSSELPSNTVLPATPPCHRSPASGPPELPLHTSTVMFCHPADLTYFSVLDAGAV